MHTFAIIFRNKNTGALTTCHRPGPCTPGMGSDYEVVSVVDPHGRNVTVA